MITQRLILDGPPPDGVWTCIACMSPLTEGRIEHPDDCPELRRDALPGLLPLVAQVEVWMLAHGWTPEPAGPAGRMWNPAGRPNDAVAILDDDQDDGGLEFPGALERIAKRSGLPFGEVMAGMRSICLPAGEGNDG